MRTAIVPGRFCCTRLAALRCIPPPPALRFQQRFFHRSPIIPTPPRPRWHRQQYDWKHRWTRHSLVGGTALLAALSPAAFLALAENGSLDDDTTVELQMLAASREEARKIIPKDIHGFRKLFFRLYLLFDGYIVEPIGTALRFLRLGIIFVPVILSVPAVWFGRRIPGRDNERPGTLWWYGFLVRAMERAGPAFIKLGQWAASRTDIFPPELCALLSSLHSNAPAHSFRETKHTISRAFNGLAFEDIFEEFDEQPLGVGAIAQVYKAKLRSDLTVPHDLEPQLDLRARVRKNVDILVKSSPQHVPSSYVAVKVLHPGVHRVVRRDLRIMGFFAAVLNAIPTMEWLSLPDEVHQFGGMMRLQLDLRIEATNLSLFRENFKTRITAWFPYPYLEYTTREVLVEEYAQGIPLAAFLESGGGVFQKEIAQEGLDAFLHMVLIDNFVHADLHPGNIMVRFYKPGQLDLSLRTRRGKPSGKPSQKAIDDTEAVLARLRPHRKDPEKWNAVLSEIDAEGYRPQLIFIDTGLVTELNKVNRENFLALFRAVAEFDGYRAGHLMVERCRQPDAVLDAEIFALKMQHLVLAVKGRTFALGNVKIGDVLYQVLSMVREHHVRLEGDFVNVVISILLLEGIGRSLDPSLDLFKSALPILRQLGSGSTLIKSVRAGDTSMLRVWIGLETRSILQASMESVERCVKYDQLSPNI
ncbi:Atypical/ABC1/ABC1-C protein kinase [Polytolypa hystricis UAMH7299]|uniref:Atypical/ABC1/ABC1-C protein kinase n=1 Tax=Polytolypa hystricis (strain UAMH7299) TaxID=1447883 RepID=A0A2B7XXP4_POLH7|nr:Atypical/ABC1/ABC1-C protein kinase [Polytolypa hystricis UAMH7299]